MLYYCYHIHSSGIRCLCFRCTRPGRLFCFPPPTTLLSNPFFSISVIPTKTPTCQGTLYNAAYTVKWPYINYKVCSDALYTSMILWCVQHQPFENTVHSWYNSVFRVEIHSYTRGLVTRPQDAIYRNMHGNQLYWFPLCLYVMFSRQLIVGINVLSDNSSIMVIVCDAEGGTNNECNR